MKSLKAPLLVITSSLLASACGFIGKSMPEQPSPTELSPGRFEITANADVNEDANRPFENKARQVCGGDFVVENTSRLEAHSSNVPQVVGIVRCASADELVSQEPLTRQALKAGQQKLTELGYNPGPADGLMGSRTRSAIKQLQLDNKLQGTGIIDAGTLRLLGL